jgi:hypothetical protein
VVAAARPSRTQKRLLPKMPCGRSGPRLCFICHSPRDVHGGSKADIRPKPLCTCLPGLSLAALTA